MKVGKKSLLFGVHQFLWHPFTVFLAWWELYGPPNWKEAFCIFVHDWGYWHSSDIDGNEGELHPEYAAQLAGRFWGTEYRDLCLYHSRRYANLAGKQPSRLCWADKLSVKYDPWWFYIFRAWLSGELQEYRLRAARAGSVPLTAKHREWHKYFKDLFINIAIEKRF